VEKTGGLENHWVTAYFNCCVGGVRNPGLWKKKKKRKDASVRNWGEVTSTIDLGKVVDEVAAGQK